MNTILLATDGSPSAERATDEAIALARASGAELHVVTSWTIPASAFGYAIYVPEIGDEERKRGEQALAATLAQIQREGITAVGVLRQGDPATEICDAAREYDADVIVMGSHGWSRLRRFVLGSVSTSVLHHAPCPVFIARGDRPTAGTEARERDAVGAGV